MIYWEQTEVILLETYDAITVLSDCEKVNVFTEKNHNEIPSSQYFLACLSGR